jgi:hypothetical protein
MVVVQSGLAQSEAIVLAVCKKDCREGLRVLSSDIANISERFEIAPGKG